MSTPVIKITNLRKTYEEQTVVKGLSFEVNKSECFGLLGPNGAGKTTTMKLIYGKAKRDLSPDTQISILGFDPLQDELSIKYLSGLVPQDNNLDSELTVFQNLLVYSKFYAIPHKQAVLKIKELLDFLELSEKSGSKLHELSGGMKRRLVIARALINNPKLLLLDEPTTGLDPQVRHLIWDKLRALKKEGVTILLTTHYMDEAYQICDNIMIMDNGSKIIEGDPKALLKNQIEKFVMEIHDRHDYDALKPHIDATTIREDKTHQIVYLFANEFEHLKKLSDCLSFSSFYLRGSNLEDLFLKLTGRDLNESQ